MASTLSHNQSVKLTKSRIDQITAPPNGQAFYRDSHLKGFALRITAGGAKSFVVEKLQDLQQSLLEENEIMLHYQLSSNDLAVLKISRNNIEFVSKKVDTTFFNQIDRFMALCQRPQSSTEEYASISNYLMEQLDIDAEILNAFTKILIIPDNKISLIPFEALSRNNSKTGSFKDLDYLVKSHVISYANSATLLAIQKRESINQDISVAGFAPSFTTGQSTSNEVDSLRSGLSNLAWTKQEIRNIASYFEMKEFLDMEASEETFKNVANQYSILHVATHGLVDNEAPLFSKLVFAPTLSDSLNDGYVYTNELYNLSILAEMVVLSACNTGSGSIASGDGVFEDPARIRQARRLHGEAELRIGKQRDQLFGLRHQLEQRRATPRQRLTDGGDLNIEGQVGEQLFGSALVPAGKIEDASGLGKL